MTLNIDIASIYIHFIVIHKIKKNKNNKHRLQEQKEHQTSPLHWWPYRV